MPFYKILPKTKYFTMFNSDLQLTYRNAGYGKFLDF